eukprot:CAMPEP_0171090158 /NCGR_PEP_ID=MMETSP0766_2-20121228/29246_1 /TAXON_ID=439317 /ORGANISM="Gambierdiscus australes, Strain CAWD 149" /LENGTH=52 /DNA_ID=CAMNT_0011548121 /DNA_START=43 /DNA_END=201 /DNA_ORIENTATION=-
MTPCFASVARGGLAGTTKDSNEGTSKSAAQARSATLRRLLVLRAAIVVVQSK